MIERFWKLTCDECKKVRVFESDPDTSYKIRARADGWQFPPGKQHFCSMRCKRLTREREAREATRARPVQQS